MAEEKKEIESSEEDQKGTESEEQKEEEQKSEEEEGKGKEDFVKEGEAVSANKHNQALRKLRESEMRERDLKKQLEEKEHSKEEKETEEGSHEDDEEDDDGEKEKAKDDSSKVLDEKLKPVLDRLNQRDESDRKLARDAFFEAHPEYLSDGEKFQELLDEMDNSINPNSKDDYYTQLEKTHRILSGEGYDAEVENKKRDIASDASAVGDGAEKGGAEEEFTAEDRKIMKDTGVSEEGMRAYKKKLESGEMQILS